MSKPYQYDAAELTLEKVLSDVRKVREITSEDEKRAKFALLYGGNQRLVEKFLGLAEDERQLTHYREPAKLPGNRHERRAAKHKRPTTKKGFRP